MLRFLATGNSYFDLTFTFRMHHLTINENICMYPTQRRSGQKSLIKQQSVSNFLTALVQQIANTYQYSRFPHSSISTSISSFCHSLSPFLIERSCFFPRVTGTFDCNSISLLSTTRD